MKRLVPVGVVLSLVCVTAGWAPPPRVKAIAATRQRAACQKAEKRLNRIPMPAGAQRTRSVTDVAGRALERCEARGFAAVERSGSWRLRAPVASVTRFMMRHPLPGYEGYVGLGGFFNETDRADGQNQYQGTVVRRHGWTVVRIDFWLAWTYPPLPHETVPSNVREIDISAGLRVMDAPEVKQIVRWFDHLDVIPPLDLGGATGAPYEGPWVHFTFRAAARVSIASAYIPVDRPAGPYQPISLAIHGKSKEPLEDTGGYEHDFINRVQRLLGVCFGISPHSAYRFSLGCNTAWADEVTTKLLQRFRLPNRAQSRAHEPRGDGGLLRSPASVSGSGELVDQHRFWRVHGSVASVEAFVMTRQRLAQMASSTTGGRHVRANRNLMLDYSAIPLNHRPASRRIDATFVALPHGWTGIRADAQVAWNYPRANLTRLHRAGIAIVVRAGSTTRRITGSRVVGRIVSRFNRLEVVPPGRLYSCPAQRHRGPKVTIDFHGHGWTGRAVVHGTGVSTACNPIHFSGYEDPASLIGGSFVRWLLGPQFR